MSVPRGLVTAFSCAALFMSFASPAAAGEEHGLSFGVRTGFAWPAGRVKGSGPAPPTIGGSQTTAEDDDFGDKFVGMLPIWIDVGYRFRRNLYVGAYAQFAFAFPAAASCPSVASCSGADYRAGLQAHWYIFPKRGLDPWIGLGLGYEVLTFSSTQPGDSVDQSFRGVELFDLQVGVDAKATEKTRFGPFVSLSFAQFTGASSTLNGVQTTVDLTPNAPHLWLMVGARAQYDL